MCRLTAGELSYLNSVQIEKLSKSMNQSNEATQTLNSVIETFQKEVSTFKESYTPIDMGLKLHRANQDINARLQAAECAITSKINRSEVDHIEAMVERLKMFESFRDNAMQEIESLKDLLKAQDDDWKRCWMHMDASDQRFIELNNSIQRCAPKSETRALAEQIDAHQETLDLLWHREAESSKSLAVAQQDLHQVVEVLSKKVSSADLRSYVPYTQYDQAITELQNDIDKKSNTLQEEVEVSFYVLNLIIIQLFFTITTVKIT